MDLNKQGITSMLKLLYMSDRAKTLFDYRGGTAVVYVGRARQGTKVRNAKWQIQNWTYNAAGDVIAIRYAEGSDDFGFRWTRRTTYTYS